MEQNNYSLVLMPVRFIEGVLNSHLYTTFPISRGLGPEADGKVSLEIAPCEDSFDLFLHYRNNRTNIGRGSFNQSELEIDTMQDSRPLPKGYINLQRHVRDFFNQGGFTVKERLS